MDNLELLKRMAERIFIAEGQQLQHRSLERMANGRTNRSTLEQMTDLANLGEKVSRARTEEEIKDLWEEVELLLRNVGAGSDRHVQHRARPA
jgi:hypothetical protein